METSDPRQTVPARRRLITSGQPRLGATLALSGLVIMALLGGCTNEIQAELTVSAKINAFRTESGVDALTPDATLVRIARARSADMAANSYFGHVPPNGCDYVCLMDQQGVGHAYAGETIAWNTYDWSQTAASAVEMWANSPPHRTKMLHCHFRRFGVGVAKAADGRTYLTAIYEGSANC